MEKTYSRYCRHCGRKTAHTYEVIYNFGDPNLGVAHDWVNCTKCGNASTD